jgi:hypothetical protein
LVSARAILAKYLSTAEPCATATHSAYCRPILMSCLVPSLALLGSPVRHDVEPWRVVDDWPARVLVTAAEIDIFEACFGDVFDELFGPSR